MSQTIGDLDGPVFGLATTGKEVVVLKQESLHITVPVESGHLFDDRLWVAQASEQAALGFIERANAAKAAIPRATSTGEDRGRRQSLRFSNRS